MTDWTKIKKQLILFLQTQSTNIGIKNITIGLSGGLDSALVALLCKEAFGEKLKCILMPSLFSSQSSVDDAKELCEKFQINFEVISISPLIKAYINNMNDDKLRIGNYSARMRMSVLYDISARDKSLVIGTSNKSEILLGYGTIFGDIACAINPIGNIYKSDEYDFARYMGVTQNILNKAPSADLWEGQSDEEELGYTYEQIDEVLKLLVDKKIPKKELLNLNFNENLIDMLRNKIKINAFKGEVPIIADINWS